MTGKVVTKKVVNEAGEFEEVILKYLIDWAPVTAEEFAAMFPDHDSAPVIRPKSNSAWPMASEAVAVHPDQIVEAAESARAKGVPTDFDATGRPVFRDRGHRKAYLKAYKYHDKDGGFGD